MPNPIQIDIGKIQQRIFEHPEVRRRIVRDYGISSEPGTPQELATAVVAELGQTPSSNPLGKELGNRAVFEAAVMSLASNSRSWANFLRYRPKLVGMLGGCDPLAAHADIVAGIMKPDDLAACMPGQTSGGDARAICRWAALLSTSEDYYQSITGLARAFADRARQMGGFSLRGSEHLLCVAGYMGNPRKNEPYVSLLQNLSHPLSPEQAKLPGMSYVLASEFLRNLGWSGFKPDRHIQRLFQRWFPEPIEAVEARLVYFQNLIGRREASLANYLRYSLLGIEVSPPGYPLSYVDNLVWLLGAYVEKKGKESNESYVTCASANVTPKIDHGFGEVLRGR